MNSFKNFNSEKDFDTKDNPKKSPKKLSPKLDIVFQALKVVY